MAERAVEPARALRDLYAKSDHAKAFGRDPITSGRVLWWICDTFDFRKVMGLQG